MAASGNTIEASFGIDLAPLKQGFAQAQSIAKTGAAQVANTMTQSMSKASTSSRTVPMNWANVYGSPGGTGTGGGPRRFRTAADFAPAPRGKYPSPTDEESGGGLNIPTRGIGRGLTIILALREVSRAYEESIQKAKELGLANAKAFASIAGGTAVPTSQIEAKFSEIAEINDKMREQKFMEAGGGKGGLYGVVGLGRKLLRKAGGQSDEEDAADAKHRQDIAVSAAGQLADQQRELNNIEEEGRTGSEEKAELLKADLTNRQKLLKISEQEVKAGLIGRSANANAENERFNNEQRHIKDIFALKKLEADIDDKIVETRGRGLTKEQESLAVIGLKLDKKSAELSAEHTVEGKRKIQTEIGGLEADQREAQFAASDMSPAAVRTRNAANLEALKRRAFNTNMAQAEDPNRAAYGAVVSGIGQVGPQSFPGPNVQFNDRDLNPAGTAEVAGKKDQQISGAITAGEMKDLMEKYWGN